MAERAEVWVTRAQPGASVTAARLRERGWTPLVAPLIELRPLEARLDTDGVGALAFTSANAVAAAARLAGASLPVFAVGDATAEAARRAGVSRVESAAGDVRALAELVRSRRVSFGGDLLHPGAAEPAGDLAALLEGAVRVRSVPVYETVEVGPSAAARSAWPQLAAVLLHSPKAAKALAKAAWPVGPRALCLSPAVAEALGVYLRVAVAPYPAEEALLNLLDAPEPRSDGET